MSLGASMPGLALPLVAVRACCGLTTAESQALPFTMGTALLEKKNQQNKKATFKMGESICKPCIKLQGILMAR